MAPNDLIKVVDQQRIWGQLVGHERLGDRFLRPAFLGSDSKPDCKLGIKGDKIRFYDPARGISWDILDCYAYLYPQDSWQQTIERILAWNGSAGATHDLIARGELWQPKFVLTPKVIDWTPWGIDFWEKRGVSLDRLNNKKTLTQEICGHEMSGTNEQGDFFTAQFGQGFVYWCNGKPKCYYPDAPKEKKFKGRFLNDDVWIVNRRRLRESKGRPDTKTLLLAKSNKDFLVWSTIVDCDLMTVAAEGVFPSSNWLMENVRMKYERVIIVFDPDEAGVLGAKKLLNTLESMSDIGTFVVKSWPWPDPVTKDLDKYRVTYGYDQTIKFMKQNNFHKIFE